MKIKRLLGIVALAVASVGILAACGKDAAKDKTVVRVGTMAKSESEQARWDKVEEILKKEGITLKFSEFTDYSQPNVALNNGEIDINAFQHYNFLDNWNADHKTDLVPIAETYLRPSVFTQEHRVIRINTRILKNCQMVLRLLSQMMLSMKVVP